MASIRKTFGTDRDLERSGVWLRWDASNRVKVARMDETANPAYGALQLQYARQYASQHAAGTMTTELLSEIERELIVRTVIKDWEIEDDDGSPIPFSADTARSLLKELPEWQKWLSREASKVDHFRPSGTDGTQELAGNSQPS